MNDLQQQLLDQNGGSPFFAAAALGAALASPDPRDPGKLPYTVKAAAVAAARAFGLTPVQTAELPNAIEMAMKRA